MTDEDESDPSVVLRPQALRASPSTTSIETVETLVDADTQSSPPPSPTPAKRHNSGGSKNSGTSPIQRTRSDPVPSKSRQEFLLSDFQGVSAGRPSPMSRMRTEPSTKNMHPKEISSMSGIAPSRFAETPASGFERRVSNMTTTHVVDIAHCGIVQALFDKYHVPWAVQYEIARGVTQDWWRWSDITPQRVKDLSSYQALLSLSRTLCQSAPLSEKGYRIAQELEREQLALIEGQGRGSGLMGTWQGEENWFGGKVQQIARVVRDKESFRLLLEPMESRQSNHLARRFGSWRFLHVKLSEDLLHTAANAVSTYFSSNRFLLCGRFFEPFVAKDSTVYMVETDDNFERESMEEEADHHRQSFLAFVKSLNPPEDNGEQVTGKWGARFHLLLSNSVPVLEFNESGVGRIDDVDNTKEGKIADQFSAPENCMTDGSGMINKTAMISIAQALRRTDLPSAVQGRFLGSKGVWVRCDDGNATPVIYTRDSQRKIRLDSIHNKHRSWRIFDLLTVSRVSEGHLNAQAITCLSFGDVRSSTFKQLLRTGLQAELADFVSGNTHPELLKLAAAVFHRTGLMRSRLSDLLGQQSRAQGMGRRESHRDSDALAKSESSSRRYPARESNAEIIMRMLLAGFDLSENAVRGCMKAVITTIVNQWINKFRISVPQSAEAMIIPDPTGVLAPGQIQFQFSEKLIDPNNGLQIVDRVMGTCLVFRNPLRVRSDIQKVEAVSHPELQHLYDVIIFPREGYISLANMLSGGDYDGDTVTVIWNRTVVDQFNQSSLVRAPDDLLHTYFTRHSEKVCELFARIGNKPLHEQTNEVKAVLVGELREKHVGIYSTFHDYSVYHRGYDHPLTELLAHIGNVCLDSAKTGYRIKPDVLKNHGQEKRRFKRPDYLPALSSDPTPQEQFNLQRREFEKAFILDVLQRVAREEGEKIQTTLRNLPEATGKDPDLISPYRQLESRASQAAKAYPDLPQFVDELKAAVRKAWSAIDEAHRKYPVNVDSVSPRGKSNLSDERRLRDRRQKRDAAIAKAIDAYDEYASGPHLLMEEHEIRRLMASYSYHHAMENPTPEISRGSIGFMLASDELLKIKAEATGKSVAINADMYNFLQPATKAIRSWTALQVTSGAAELEDVFEF